MGKTHESSQQNQEAKPIQANKNIENGVVNFGANPSHSRILNLQRTVGNQAVQRIISEESSGEGAVQRRWNPPFLGDRIRNFANVAQSLDEEYDWFNVEAKRWDGGTPFADSVPPPGSPGRESIQPPAGYSGTTETAEE